MTRRLTIAIGACILAVGAAGPPLNLPRVALGAVICAGVIVSGRFSAAIAMATTIATGWLQHGQFRLTLLLSGTLLGIATHLLRNNLRGTATLAALSAVAGLVLLLIP